MATPYQETFEFCCNICETVNFAAVREKHRELLHCSNCRSCARFRGIAKAILSSFPVIKEQSSLTMLQPMKHIRGIGMSDSDAYANELARVFDYTNTYYHTVPHLDVTDRESAAQYKNLDFVISSDVLEHVKAPVSEAFRNIIGMLSPGGYLILTVPYLEGYETIEHFPHLNNYQIVKTGSGYVLINERANGSIEVHQSLSFHGGPGSVLEMRVFGEGDLLSMLRYAGFESIRTLTPDDDSIGYCWEDVVDGSSLGNRVNKSHVLICQRPMRL